MISDLCGRISKGKIRHRCPFCWRAIFCAALGKDTSHAFSSCFTASCMAQPFRVIPESALCERLCSLFIFPHQQSVKDRACIFFFFPTSFLLSQPCILCCCWQDIMLLLQQTKCKLSNIVVYHLTILSAFSICEGPWEITFTFISLH